MVTRERALKWWQGLSFEDKWFNIVQNKSWVKGYPDRSPDLLSDSEIELIYTNRTI